jgi:uncharacterized protein YecE (DUF72 family)
MGRLRFGTSSWSEKSWAGVFYPPGLPPGEWLRHYATQFDTVEADVTYYRVPDERLVRGWDEKTPPGFTLCAKFPRAIVHGGEGAVPDPGKVLVPEAVSAELEQFLASMALLGAKCGPLVLQFPYFNRSVFAEPGVFLERLARFLGVLPRDFRYAVEIRNKAWIGSELLALLRAHRAALVWVEIGYMPHPERLARGLDLVTTDFAYARLIGERAAIEQRTETFDRVVVDKQASLERWSRLLRATLERVPETFAFANNHYAGHAPATIRQLAELVSGST